MPYLQRAEEAVRTVNTDLQSLPELQGARDALIKEDPDRILGENPVLTVAKIYLNYLRLIKELVSLNEEEIALIAQANKLCEERELSHGAAVAIGADDFMQILGQEGISRLRDFISESSNPNSEIFQKALADLVSRMTAGHNLHQQGKEVSDGASAEADFAIWGHTKNLQPLAMVHFVICHFLERTFTALFQDDKNEKIKEFVAHKDTLLVAMGDVIRLRSAQGRIGSEILSTWQRSIEEGGLGWNTQDKQDAYNQVIKKLNTTF